MTSFPTCLKRCRTVSAILLAAVTGVLSGMPVAVSAETGESLETFARITSPFVPLQVIERLESGSGLLRDVIVKRNEGKSRVLVEFLPKTDPTAPSLAIRPVFWFFYGTPAAVVEPRSIYSWRNSSYDPAIAMPNPPVEGASVTTITLPESLFMQPREEIITRWGEIERRTTTSGFGYDAVALNYESAHALEKSRKLYWGHMLGIVGVEEREVVRDYPTNSLITSLGFDLYDLPSPQAESPVIEYRNTKDFPNSPGGQFFYTADPGEQAFVDGGGAGAYLRTGKSFKSGGYVRACRFYGSQSPGPNSHFYTADDAECKGLRAQQQVPVPDDLPQWNSEGIAFSINAIKLEANGDRSCPSGSIPVYRAYNRAFDGAKKNSWNSNHRLSIAQEDIDEMVRTHGWVNEGAVMCAAM